MGDGSVKRIFVILLLVAIVIAGLYGYSLSQVQVRDVRISSLQDISFSGFTLGGSIELYNGGILPVGVDYVTYKVVLEETDLELASGRIEGKTISPKNVESFPFSNKVNWVPSAELALRLVTPGKSYAKVSGIVNVADFGIVDFKVPFEARVDLESYIRQFARQKIEQTIDRATKAVQDTVGNIGEGIKSVTGKVIDVWENLFG